jgi:hypothetical protein
MRTVAIGFSLVMITCSWQAVAAESTEVQHDVQRYTVKESTSITGTNFHRDIIKAGAIPLDKRYGQLTSEQKNILKSPYEKMGPADEPPFPSDGLMPILAPLAKLQEKTDFKFKGPLTLYVSVDNAGKATSVSVVDSPDPGIAKVAALALMSQTYKPAVCNGAPCSMQYPFHVDLIGVERMEMHTFNPDLL